MDDTCFSASTCSVSPAKKPRKRHWKKPYASVAKHSVGLFVLFAFLCVIHGALQYLHYTKCKKSIIHVIMYRDSEMCVQMNRMLSVIESICSKDVLGLLNFTMTNLTHIRAII